MTTKPIPHGTVAGYNTHRCRCIPCSDASAAYAKRKYRRIGAGVWQPFVDATRAREHVEALHAQGMAYLHIAAATGVTWGAFERLLHPVSGRPQTQRIRPETEARILAVRFNIDALPDNAKAPARGAGRRITALRAHGWPLPALAGHAGMPVRTLGDAQRQDFILASNFRIICELYDDLRTEDPRAHGVPEQSVLQALATARRARLAPPTAWDDIDLDDEPAPRRTWRVEYRRRQPQDRRDAVLEETAHLASFGLTREQIAERLGVTWEAVFRVHLRAGQPLPRPLRQEVAA